MSKVRMYGNFTEVRSNFSMPLKLIPRPSLMLFNLLTVQQSVVVLRLRG